MKEPGAKGRFASTIANDLQQLSVREKLIAKNEIRSINFKYQIQMLKKIKPMIPATFQLHLSRIKVAVTICYSFQVKWSCLTHNCTK